MNIFSNFEYLRDCLLKQLDSFNIQVIIINSLSSTAILLITCI
jgi:hypothetical protein